MSDVRSTRGDYNHSLASPHNRTWGGGGGSYLCLTSGQHRETITKAWSHPTTRPGGGGGSYLCLTSGQHGETITTAWSHHTTGPGGGGGLTTQQDLGGGGGLTTQQDLGGGGSYLSLTSGQHGETITTAWSHHTTRPGGGGGVLPISDVRSTRGDYNHSLVSPHNTTWGGGGLTYV